MSTSREAGVLWSRKDVGDMFEGVLTPLGASFCEAYQRDVHPACVAAMGLRDVGDARLYYRVVDGHLYANVAYFAHLYSQTPLGRDLGVFTRAFASDDVDVASYANPYGRHWTSGAVDALAHWGGAQARTLARVVDEARRLRPEEPRATFQRISRFTRTGPNDGALARALDASLARFRRVYAAYLPVVFNAFALHAATSELARLWLGEAHVPVAAWSRALLDARRDERRALHDLARATRDTHDAAAARFVSAFGATGTQEMDLARPRWRDDPRALRARALAIAARREEPPAVLGAPHALVARAAIPLARKAALLALVAAHAAHARARARLRTSVVNAIWEVRALVFETARRLAARRVLASPGDVAYASLDEIRAAATGSPLPERVLDVRRRIHDLRLALPAPPVSFLGDPPARAPRAELYSSASSA